MKNDRISAIKNDFQDRNSEAWIKLCESIEKVAQEEREEFSPYQEIGSELFAQIYTLPESISKLKTVKKLYLYGSNLKRIPPEIGEMESLETFTPYTSYDLHWFPYEILNCQKLKDSTVSTRALFGNPKNGMRFPDLSKNPVRYLGDIVRCSICNKEMTYEQTNQLWINLWVATDILPLLANLCSKDCELKLPIPPKQYIHYAHKGGIEIKRENISIRGDSIW